MGVEGVEGRVGEAEASLWDVGSFDGCFFCFFFFIFIKVLFDLIGRMNGYKKYTIAGIVLRRNIENNFVKKLIKKN